MEETRALTKMEEAVVRETAETLGLRIKKLHRRISWEEFNERWFKGLCMLCDEPETPDHHLRHKNSGILMIDCDEDQMSHDKELVETEVATESSETEQRTVNHEATADMNLALLEEESIPQFQVPIANSEILKSGELREVKLEKLEVVAMNKNLVQDGIPKNIHKIFVVHGDVEKSQNVISNTKLCSAHQMFGKMSQQKERLGIKKKRKGFKSWMFKYRRGFKKLHTLTFSTSMRMVVSQQMDMVETTSDLLLLNGKDNLPRTALGYELEAGKIDSLGQERSELCTENKEEVKGCLEQRNVIVDSVKVKEVNMETQIVDRGMSLSIAVLETGMDEIIGSHATMAFVFKQTSISYSQCMEHNLFDTMLLTLRSKKKQKKCHKSWMFKYKLMKKNKFSKTWFMSKGDCFKEDDQVYHETLPIWRLTRFKFWKFRLLNMDLGKTRPQIEDVMGEVHKRQHGDNASDTKVIETLKDPQQFPLGEVMFQIKHKWRVKFLLLVSELEFSFESVACVALLDEQFSVEKTLVKATGTCGEDLQQLARVFNEQLLQTCLVIQVVMRNKIIKFPKRWMFKYKASLKNIQFLHFFSSWAIQMIVGKRTPNVDITDANKQFEYKREGRWLENIHDWCIFSTETDALMIKHFLLSDGRFQIKHKWRFKLLPSSHMWTVLSSSLAMHNSWYFTTKHSYKCGCFFLQLSEVSCSIQPSNGVYNGIFLKNQIVPFSIKP